jgi:hypothetical protein
MSILFIGYFLFITLAQSAKVIKKYNLYDKPIHHYKMGFSTTYLKRKITDNSNNKQIVKELSKSLKYTRLARLFLFFFLLVFCLGILMNQYEL